MRGDPTDGRVRLGGPYAKRARRAEIKSLLKLHMYLHQERWFTAVELARVLRDNYLSDPTPMTASHYRYGRSNITLALLRELSAAGLIKQRPHPDRRDATQWHWNGETE